MLQRWSRPGRGSGRLLAPSRRTLTASSPDGARPARRGARPAQALVEFALVSMLLAMLCVGVADLGRAFYYDIMVSSAALEGARAAASGAPDTTTTQNGKTTVGAKNIAVNTASSFLSTNSVQVNPPQATRALASGVGQCSPSTCVYTTVTVTYTFSPITPFLQYLVGSSITMTRTVSQRMQTQCALADGTLCT